MTSIVPDPESPAGTPRQHHVELFQEDGFAGWGWQCFTCGHEGPRTAFARADQAAQDHGRLAGDSDE